MASRDDDEDLSRQATVLANAEELSREHSLRRAVKLREERVRPLGSSGKRSRDDSLKGSRGEGRGRTEDNAKSARSESRSRSDDERTRKVEDSSGRRQRPARPRARPKGVEDPLKQNVAEGSGTKSSPGDASPRLSDPFPPIRKKGKGSTNPSSPSLPKLQQQQAQQRAEEELPSRRPLPAPSSPRGGYHSGPYRQIQGGASSSDIMAMELEELLRRFRGGWRRLEAGDKIAVLSSLMVLAGTLMPWVSLPGAPLQVGLFSGGLVHAAIAVVVMRYVTKGFENEFEFSPAELDRRRARRSLYIVLLGALSTVFGAYLLLMWGAQKAPEHPIHFHWGLYWTLACGTGVSYGGFARFGTGGPR